MNLILRSFFRGLLFVVPVAATIAVLLWLFQKLDSLVDADNWFGKHVPGLGIAIMFVAVTAIGLVGSSFFARWLVKLVDRLFQNTPFVKLIYSAIKDLLEAFVGDNKKFDTPVLVSLGEAVGAEAIGFITRRDLSWLGREGSVAVYFPQSYNFAGSVLVFPTDRLTSVEADSSEVMQFIVSGGVSGGIAAPAEA
ncbi:MAG: putative membrane protein [Planctomycetota bacterium]|jgi:uncharacterized membrane protein